MIEISAGTKVYVYCPEGVMTGGAELLHQLVHILNEAGRAAYMVYHSNVNQEIVEAEIPVAYRNYHLKTTAKIDDAAENIVVLYEAIFDKYRTVKSCQLFFWWLSVDNFFLCSKDYLATRDYFDWDPKFGLKIFKSRVGKLFKGRNLFKTSFSLDDMRKLPAVHGYQSEYAQHFLLSKGFSEILPLKDFINLDFYSPDRSTIRENKVLYNPKKGFEFTKELMSRAPHLKWVALEKMDRAQLLHEFQTSKLYIDFGYHPGKDRIPREAAMNGCCIITNTRGSARYFEDVGIYNAYKLEESKVSYSDIIRLMEDILNNYEQHTGNFDFYRKAILNEKEEFVNQVHHIFRL